MPTFLVASLQPAEGRTAVTAGLGARIAEEGRTVRLLRLRGASGADPAAEDDARTLSLVPGCQAPGAAVTEQEALAQTNEANAAGEFCLVEASAGPPADLAARLSARVVLVTPDASDERLGEIAGLGDTLGGVVVTRQRQRRLAKVRDAVEAMGLTCLAVLPEDRLLAQPTPNEMAEAFHASRLAESDGADEAVENVMLGPIAADPGQPYFLSRPGKAVINRFDKMDLHLAALATEPECLILTGGQLPSPYFLDRLQGSDVEATVLLSPEGTVRTMELLDELYTRTRFAGRRKVRRAAELVREQIIPEALAKLIG